MVDRVEVGQRSRIARLVLPGLKVHDLGSADTEEDLQNFQACDLLGQRRVKAGATLLDIRKVKSRREGDRFEVVGKRLRALTAKMTLGKVSIASGNCRMLPYCQTRDCLRERSTEIGVRCTAVPSPPSRVHRELHKVCEPSDLPGPGRCAAWQSSKLIKVDGWRIL